MKRLHKISALAMVLVLLAGCQMQMSYIRVDSELPVDANGNPAIQVDMQQKQLEGIGLPLPQDRAIQQTDPQPSEQPSEPESSSGD